MQRFQLYIDGAFTDGSGSFDSIDPATGQPWAEMPEAREDQVNAAVDAAQARAIARGLAGVAERPGVDTAVNRRPDQPDTATLQQLAGGLAHMLATEKNLVDGAVALRPGVLRLIQAGANASVKMAIATTTSPVNIAALGDLGKWAA